MVYTQTIFKTPIEILKTEELIFLSTNMINFFLNIQLYRQKVDKGMLPAIIFKSTIHFLKNLSRFDDY